MKNKKYFDYKNLDDLKDYVYLDYIIEIKEVFYEENS